MFNNVFIHISKLNYIFCIPYSIGFTLKMHAEDFRKDAYGLVTKLRDGGYSDDMTLAAIAGNGFASECLFIEFY